MMPLQSSSARAEEGATELVRRILQHRPHAHHRKQHDVEAIRYGGEPAHVCLSARQRCTCPCASAMIAVFSASLNFPTGISSLPNRAGHSSAGTRSALGLFAAKSTGRTWQQAGRPSEPLAAPPRDQLTSLDRRECPHGVIKLETIGNVLVDVLVRKLPKIRESSDSLNFVPPAP